MRKEDFAEVLGDINEKHIVEARVERKAKKSVWIKWGAMAACLCLAVAGVIHLNADDSLNTGNVIPDGATIETENVGSGNSYEESNKETNTIASAESGKQDTEFEDAPGTVVDAPSFEISSDLASYMEDEIFVTVYGGSYLDENGNWVVWLTENTEDFRCAALARNPALPEVETIFRTADYSLAYLTELLENISEGMRDGTLPYVTAAGVMEQINRVSVTMTTNDEKAVATVSSFDTLGGAIEFHYAVGYSKGE